MAGDSDLEEARLELLSEEAVELTELALDPRWLSADRSLILDRPVNTGALLADLRLREWLRLFIIIPGMVAGEFRY